MNSELPTSNIIIIIKFACLFVCLINLTFILHPLLIFCHFSLCFVLAFFFFFFFLRRGGGVVVSIMTVTDWRYCL